MTSFVGLLNLVCWASAVTVMAWVGGQQQLLQVIPSLPHSLTHSPLKQLLPHDTLSGVPASACLHHHHPPTSHTHCLLPAASPLLHPKHKRSHIVESCDPQQGEWQWRERQYPNVSALIGSGQFGSRGGPSGQCMVWRAEEDVATGQAVCNGYGAGLQDRTLLQYGFLQVSGLCVWRGERRGCFWMQDGALLQYGFLQVRACCWVLLGFWVAVCRGFDGQAAQLAVGSTPQYFSTLCVCAVVLPRAACPMTHPSTNNKLYMQEGPPTEMLSMLDRHTQDRAQWYVPFNGE